MSTQLKQRLDLHDNGSSTQNKSYLVEAVSANIKRVILLCGNVYSTPNALEGVLSRAAWISYTMFGNDVFAYAFSFWRYRAFEKPEKGGVPC